MNDRFFYCSYIRDPMTLKQADLHYMIGYVMLYLGRKDEAKACFEKSLSLNPDNVKAALELKLLRESSHGNGQRFLAAVPFPPDGKGDRIVSFYLITVSKTKK